ncbi:MAG: phosphoenolpyruvate--protein phosphotransferase [Oscillospiraceae bacterium]|nr:phosphoenolpyruvate--protein phosphotransferase [Oscillospiraceae bacterium]
MKITGTGACPGIVIAPVLRLQQLPAFSLEKRDSQTPRELLAATVNNAVLSLRASLKESIQVLYARGETVKGEVLESHLALLEDPALIEAVQGHVAEGYALESAIQRSIDSFCRQLQRSGSSYIAQRTADLKDLGNRLTCAVLGIEYPSLSLLSQDVILVAQDIPPSVLAGASPAYIRGIATAEGGSTSHTAIIAGSMGVPCVVGCGAALSALQNGEELFLDGVTGALEWGFDAQRRERLVYYQNRQDLKRSLLRSMAERPTRTRDGTPVELSANLSDLSGLEQIRDCRADGVGLYRTEFLFLGRDTCPGEEEQFQEYRQAVQAMEGKPLVFRTLDVGGDKNVPFFNLQREENPFLGYRAVRLYSDFEGIFLAQLRAILRAGAFGPVSVMFPMISSVEEFLRTKKLFDRTKKELRRRDIPFGEEIPVGAMVEVPSAAINADALIRHADFFSIGTNDLTQYTLAVDRMNHSVANLYSYFDPAVLRLIFHTIRIAGEWEKPCSVCGEMAADGLAIPLLLGMGLRKFSVSPWSLLRVRKLVSLCDVQECEALARRVLQLPGTEDILVELNCSLPRGYAEWLR